MKQRFAVLLTFFMSSIFLVSCTQSAKINSDQRKSILSMPDKIIIYNENNPKKELNSSDSQFKKIVELTNNRFESKLSIVKDIIDDTTMKDIFNDGLGIEFIYSTEQELSIDTADMEPIKFHKLYFPLTSEKYGNDTGSPMYLFQYGDESHYKASSRGPLKYSEELIKIVKDL